MEKETWINAVLCSPLEKKSAPASDELYQKIQQKIKTDTVSVEWAFPLAAAILVLVGLNLYFIVHHQNNRYSKSTNNEFAYFSTSNQLYSHDEN